MTYTNLITISFSVRQCWLGHGHHVHRLSGPEYVSGIDFSTVTARYLKIYATGGDNILLRVRVNSYGSPVPLPGAVSLLGSGLGFLAWRRKRG